MSSLLEKLSKAGSTLASSIKNRVPVTVYIQTAPSACVCPHHSFGCTDWNHDKTCELASCVPKRTRINWGQSVRRATLERTGKVAHNHDPTSDCYDAAGPWCHKGQPMTDATTEQIKRKHPYYKRDVMSNDWSGFGHYTRSAEYTKVADGHGNCSSCKGQLSAGDTFSVPTDASSTVRYCANTACQFKLGASRKLDITVGGTYKPIWNRVALQA